jgi:hypothetical protein
MTMGEPIKTQPNQQLNLLIKQILLFLIYLSENNEFMKISIYKEMKPILTLCKSLFKRKTLLLFFITKVLKDSQILQESIVEEKHTKTLFRRFNDDESGRIVTDTIETSLSIGEIFEYILNCEKYFYYLKKILNYNKTNDQTFKKMIEDTIRNNEDKMKSNLEENIRHVIKYHNEDNDKKEILLFFLEQIKKINLNNFLFTKEILLFNLLQLSYQQRLTTKEICIDTHRSHYPTEQNERADLISNNDLGSLRDVSSVDLMIEQPLLNKTTKRMEFTPIFNEEYYLKLKNDVEVSKMQLYAITESNPRDVEKLISARDVANFHSVNKIDNFETKLIYILNSDISIYAFQEVFEVDVY